MPDYRNLFEPYGRKEAHHEDALVGCVVGPRGAYRASVMDTACCGVSVG